METSTLKMKKKKRVPDDKCRKNHEITNQHFIKPQ